MDTVQVRAVIMTPGKRACQLGAMVAVMALDSATATEEYSTSL